MRLPEYELDHLAFDFFKLFSRFEYALKASGYYKNEKTAKPNWERFAEDTNHIFDTMRDSDLKNAVDFLLTYPPQKQFIIDGKVKYQEEKIEGTTAKKLITYIKRVRNNLFHGGKFNGEWFDPERSKPLITNSIVVLEACLEKSEKVRDAYYSY